jgi:hypothetical protein
MISRQKVNMAKKKARRPASVGDRDRIVGRRRSKLPLLLLTIITAVASLALIVAGILNFGAPR